MISGRQALATVEQAIGRARAEEGRLDAALRSASEEAVRLRTARMDAFRKLARLKLDEGLMGEIDSTEARALALVEEWRRDFERVSTLRTRAQENAEMTETDRHARADDYEKAAKELHELRNRVEADAVVTAAWAAQRDRIEQLRNVADRAEGKAAQAEADRDLKRKPYDADPLFRYLWERRFGSADYQSGALTCFIDGWVARLIGYSGARANYALLNDLPSRLREHVSYVRKELQVEETRLTTIEREALVNAGIGALEQRAADSKAVLDTAEKTLADARIALAELDSKHRAVLDGAPYHHPQRHKPSLTLGHGDWHGFWCRPGCGAFLAAVMQWLFRPERPCSAPRLPVETRRPERVLQMSPNSQEEGSQSRGVECPVAQQERTKLVISQHVVTNTEQGHAAVFRHTAQR